MSLREPAFDHDYEIGAQAQMFVDELRAGFRDQRIETKYDLRAPETGNLYIEYECLRRGAWRPSGLQETTALYWSLVLREPHVALIISVEHLRQLTEGAWLAGHGIGARRGQCLRGSHPTRGVLLNIGHIIASCKP